MRLTDVLSGVDFRLIAGSPDGEISGVAYDSRDVSPGDLFVCLSGLNVDGHDFALSAVERGASVLMAEHALEAGGVTVVTTEDTRVALPRVAANFFGHPAAKLQMIGITGTNGKTTTAYMVESIFRNAGLPIGVLGTIEYRLGGRVWPVKHTTPESVELQRTLSDMYDAGAQAVVMEVSSHAIDMHRVDECPFETLVFTNLSQDHLDYHGTLDEYFSVKERIFLRETDKEPVHAINVDDPYGRRIVETSSASKYTYGVREVAAVRAFGIREERAGVDFVACIPGGEFHVHTPLRGAFNVYNALAATCVGLAHGLDEGAIADGLAALQAVPGRFEAVDCGQDFLVVVDYAHTPDGVDKLLRSAREVTDGRLITVLGCGGDRDRAKRPLMARTATDLSDTLILTSDNPRSEDPEAIIDEMRTGIPAEAYARVGRRVTDRRTAIDEAIAEAKTGDTVVIAGKGHETYQEVQGVRHPFDDRAVAREALERQGRCSN